MEAAEGLAAAGYKEESGKLFMMVLQTNFPSLDSFLLSLWRSGLGRELLPLFQYIIAEVKNQSINSNSNKDFKGIASVMAVAGLSSELLPMIRGESSAVGADWSSHIRTAAALAAVGFKNEAVTELSKGVETAIRINDEGERRGAIRSIANSLPYVDLKQELLPFYEKMIENAGKMKDIGNRFLAQYDIVVSLAKSGFKGKVPPQLKRAVLTAVEAKIQDGQVGYFYSVVGELVEAGFREETLSLFQRAIQETAGVDDASRPNIVNELSSKLASVKLGGDGVRLLYSLIQTVEENGSDISRSAALGNISKEISNMEPKEEIPALFKRLVDAAKKIKDAHLREETLKEIFGAAIGAGVMIDVANLSTVD